jgi:hypothetical protein
MATIKHIHAIATALIPIAIVKIGEEYVKPTRRKLTHFWLAEQMAIERRLAFILLEKVAKKRLFCIQLPTGPIYWDNELIPADAWYTG